MAKGKFPGKDWSKDPKGAYEFIFNTHFWGDRSNSGKDYKRRPKQSKESK